MRESILPRRGYYAEIGAPAFRCELRTPNT
jgi:hypothetical protein